MIDASYTFMRIENAAHSGAFGDNPLPEPTEAQCIAGNYKVGRANLCGLRLAIEQPRGTYRTGLDAKTGQRWASRMAAHYGYIVGTTGNDGDGVDCFIGFYPQSETAYVINQNMGGRFDEHKVMLAFPDEETARRAYQDSYERGWNGLASIVTASISQLKQWLKSGDMRRPLRREDLPQEGLETMTRKVQWDGNALPYDVTLDQVLYDIRRADACDGLLMDAVTAKDILEDSDGVLTLDALVSPYSRLERKMELLRVVMERAGHQVKPVAVQITEPFKQRGVANVAVIYELSDGQTVSIYFHNPDVTPNKIAPTDEVVSWKWMLNKKDITIVVAPERGDELNVREVARRIMRLAEKNSPAFQRVNAKRAERMQSIQALKDEIAELESELSAAQHELEVAKVEVEEAQNRKSRDYAQAVQKSSVTQDALMRATENGGIDPKTGRTKEDLRAQIDGEVTEIERLRDIANGVTPAPADEQPAGKKFDEMTFAEAQAKADELWNASTATGRALAAFPTGPMGLTPDAVRATPEWKAAYAANESAMTALRDFNGPYTKKFKKEIIAARDAKREAKLAAAGGTDQQSTPARAWQDPANRGVDPADGAEVIESWNTAKADALMAQMAANNQGQPPEFLAREFIDSHLQGRIVKTKIGDCAITSTSKSKLSLAANRKGSVKTETIARIPEILTTGEVGDFDPNYKNRRDSIVGFYPFEKTVEIHSLALKVRANVKVGKREGATPSLVYELNAKADGLLDSATEKKEAVAHPRIAPNEGERNRESATASNAPSLCDRASNVNPMLDTVADDSDGLNLTILAVWDKDGNRVSDLEDGGDEQALIDAYVRSFAEAAAVLNTAVAAVDWGGIKDGQSARDELGKLAAASRKGQYDIIGQACSALESVGIKTWDERIASLDKTGLSEWHSALNAFSEARDKIQALAKERLIEAGKAEVAALPDDAPLADMAAAIFRRAGIDTGGKAPPIATVIEAKDVDRVWSSLSNLDNKASAEIFERATGVKLAKTQRERRRQIDAWAGISPEQRAAMDTQQTEEQEAKKRADDLKWAWNGLANINAQDSDGIVRNGQEFMASLFAKGFDEVVARKKGAATVYYVSNGSSLTGLKSKSFSGFLKTALAFGGLRKALELVGAVEPQAEKTDADKIAAVDEAYRFDNATDDFKLWVTESIDKAEYSPFVTAKAMDEAVKRHGAAVEWGKFTGAALDDASCDEDTDDEDFDDESEWDAMPEIDDDETALDGDFPGHPFRGNQHRKASRSSGAAVSSSIRAKRAEQGGDAKAARSAHRAAYHAHAAAAGSVDTGAAQKYHRTMARFHAKRAGVDAVLDDAGSDLPQAPEVADDDYVLQEDEIGCTFDADVVLDGVEGMGDQRDVVLKRVLAIAPLMERFERAYGRSQWPGYLKKLISSDDYLKVFVKDRAVGDMAKIKLALSKAASAKDLSGIVKKLEAMSALDSAVMDGVDADGYVGKISKDGQVLGRIDIGDDGKAMVYVGASGDERLKSSRGNTFMYSDDDAVAMVDALFAAAPADAASAAGIRQADSLAASARVSRADQAAGDDVDYARMFTQEVLRHLRDSVLAAKNDGQAKARIESDRILSDFGDTLTPQQYKLYNQGKAEEVLFGKLAEIEKELGLGGQDSQQKTADRALFQSVIDGTVADMLSADLADQLEAAFNRNQDDAALVALFEQAVNAYQNAMMTATAGIA